MPYYESTFILKGDLEENEVEEESASIKESIEKEGGSLIKMDKWGKKRLAYRVKKNRYGHYLLVHFEIDADKSKALEWKFKLVDNILKYFVLRIEKEDMEKTVASAEPAEKAEKGEKTKETVAAN